jgi:hypothetical protein
MKRKEEMRWWLGGCVDAMLDKKEATERTRQEGYCGKRRGSGMRIKPAQRIGGIL